MISPKTEIIDTRNELSKIAEKTGVTESDRLALAEQFEEMLSQAILWAEQAKEIVVKDINDKSTMKLAKEKRIEAGKLRIETEKRRKTLKDDSLNYGRAVDAIAKSVKSMIEPTEKYLKSQEDFAKIKIEEMQEALRIEREAKIAEFDFDASSMVLGEMTQDSFDALFAGIVANDALKKQALIDERKRTAEAEKAEAERLEKIESDRLENARIKKEQDEQAAKIKKQQDEIAAAQKKIADDEKKAKEAGADRLKEIESADNLRRLNAESDRIEFDRLKKESDERAAKLQKQQDEITSQAARLKEEKKRNSYQTQVEKTRKEIEVIEQDRAEQNEALHGHYHEPLAIDPGVQMILIENAIQKIGESNMIYVVARWFDVGDAEMLNHLSVLFSPESMKYSDEIKSMLKRTIDRNGSAA